MDSHLHCVKYDCMRNVTYSVNVGIHHDCNPYRERVCVLAILKNDLIVVHFLSFSLLSKGKSVLLFLDKSL